jgi:acyl carrier protein
MDLEKTKTMITNSLKSVLEENNIKNITVTDETEIFGSKSIIDSLQLINLVVKIEEEVYERTGIEIIVVDDEAIIVGNSPFQSVKSLAEFVHKKVLLVED